MTRRSRDRAMLRRLAEASMREAVKAWHAMAVATANLLVDPVAWRAALDEVNRRTATVRRLNDRYDVVKGRMRS